MIMEYCVRNSGLEFGAPSFMMNILPLENRLFSVKHEVKKKKKKALNWEKFEVWGNKILFSHPQTIWAAWYPNYYDYSLAEQHSLCIKQTYLFMKATFLILFWRWILSRPFPKLLSIPAAPCTQGYKCSFPSITEAACSHCVPGVLDS